MSKGTKIRGIRIDETLWQAATIKAESRDETVSDVIRDALKRYVEETD